MANKLNDSLSIMEENRICYDKAKKWCRENDKENPTNMLSLSRILQLQSKLCELYIIEQRLVEMESQLDPQIKIEEFKKKRKYKVISINDTIEDAEIIQDLSSAEW